VKRFFAPSTAADKEGPLIKGFEIYTRIFFLSVEITEETHDTCQDQQKCQFRPDTGICEIIMGFTIVEKTIFAKRIDVIKKILMPYWETLAPRNHRGDRIISGSSQIHKSTPEQKPTDQMWHTGTH
jgi:hypothetical protein